MRNRPAIVALLFVLIAPCAWPQAPEDNTKPSSEHGGVAANQTYADSADGMKAQVENLFAAWRTQDQQQISDALQIFTLPDADAWFAQVFGADKAKQLSDDYKSSLDGFQSHMKWISGNWAPKAGVTVKIETSELPVPPKSGGDEAALPSPVAAIKVENFRFDVSAGGDSAPSWVNSFVYRDGAFRSVGGTYPFWHEKLQGIRPRAAQATVRQVVAIHTVPAKYPSEAKKQGIQGDVTLSIVVGPDGKAKNIQLVDGNPVLVKAAEDAIKKWKFQPFQIEGRVLEITVKVKVPVVPQ